jgi:ABC-type transport system involved in cytochrome c biogenesis permease component
VLSAGVVWAVLRREWAAYFRTPVGWILLALFLCLQGVVFWMFVRFLGRPDAPPGGVMELFFGGTMLFWIALALLATLVPMRLFAEELRSGTIEPLMTAPVAPAEVVLGKWLGAFGFYLTAWAPTLLYLVYLRAAGTTTDPGATAAGYLGALLLGGAALAVGVLTSSLTRNQLVAAALSFVALFLALLVGALEGQLGTPALAALARRFSLFRMMEDFGHGVVDTRHVALLVTVIVLALLAAIGRVATLRGPLPDDAPRERRLPRRLIPPLVVAIAVMANVIAARHFARGDWTTGRLYGLSDKTIAVLQTLPRPVEVTVFRYPGRGAERGRAVAGLLRELLERAGRYGGDRLHVAYVDPDRDPQRAEAAARRHGIGAYELSQGVVVVTSGGRARVVTEDDLVESAVDADGEATQTIRAWKGEAALLSALLTVTSDDPDRICFSQGHGEPDITAVADGGYATFADLLRGEGAEVRPLAQLGELRLAGPTGPDDGCRVLVIAEPTRALSDGELASLTAFVDAGGRLLAMPGPVFTTDGRGFARTGLEAFAARFGVTLGDALVVDPSRASDVEGPSVWAAGAANYLPHPITARMGGRLTFWPRTREVAPAGDPRSGAGPLTVMPLVRTTAEGWGETDLATIRGEADLAFDRGRDRPGPVTVAVAVERRGAHPTRLVFLGSGRLVMNYRLAGLTLRDYDADFVSSAIAWLAGRDAQVGVAPKPAARTAPAPTAAAVSWAFRLFVLGLPALALVAGALVWRRRRR